MDQGADSFDVVVVGGGPAGATAAHKLAKAGHKVLLLDRAGRTKPCGGAVPTRLIKDFEIPDHMLCARINAARMVAPSGAEVDMGIDHGFVGMVDRDVFDEFLRKRAQESGAERRVGLFDRITRDDKGAATVHYHVGGSKDGAMASVQTRLVVGADGALSQVARQEVDAKGPQYVFAYHEVVKVPDAAAPAMAAAGDYRANRCDVIYQGTASPDFYGWVFPHGRTASIGTGSAIKGFSLRGSVAQMRQGMGMEGWETLRKEGAPIPMKPLSRWDNGRDVVLAGDAAGVVAPASGEGIYYAMVGGQFAAEAGDAFLKTGNARALRSARKTFMAAHGKVFFILSVMQYFWYRNDKRRERFVSICRDKDVQELTWQGYLNKELVKAKPAAHVRIFFKDMAHLLGIATA